MTAGAGERPFEFTSATTSGQHRSLQVLDARAVEVGHVLRRAIPAMMRQRLELVPQPARLLKSSDVLAELKHPPFQLPLAIDPGGSRVMLLFDAGACGLLLETGLGGPLDLVEAPSVPEVTKAQRVALGRIAEPMARLLAEPLLGPDVQLRALPPDAALPAEGELAIVEFRIGDHAERRVIVVVSRDALTSLASAVLANQRRQLATDSKIPAVLGRVEVELVVELGRVSRSIAEIAALRVGDLLRLDAHVRAPVEVRIQERPYFSARPTTSGTTIAVSILERLKPSADTWPATSARRAEEDSEEVIDDVRDRP